MNKNILTLLILISLNLWGTDIIIDFPSLIIKDIKFEFTPNESSTQSNIHSVFVNCYFPKYLGSIENYSSSLKKNNSSTYTATIPINLSLKRYNRFYYYFLINGSTKICDNLQNIKINGIPIRVLFSENSDNRTTIHLVPEILALLYHRINNLLNPSIPSTTTLEGLINLFEGAKLMRIATEMHIPSNVMEKLEEREDELQEPLSRKILTSIMNKSQITYDDASRYDEHYAALNHPSEFRPFFEKEILPKLHPPIPISKPHSKALKPFEWLGLTAEQAWHWATNATPRSLPQSIESKLLADHKQREEERLELIQEFQNALEEVRHIAPPPPAALPAYQASSPTLQPTDFEHIQEQAIYKINTLTELLRRAIA